MKRRYASDTTVSVEKSQLEVGRILRGAGVTQQSTAFDDETGRAIVMFVLGGFKIRLTIFMPTVAAIRADFERDKPRGWYSWKEQRKVDYCTARYEQVCRSRWRVMVMTLKTKLELVEIGASTYEREFLADTVLPNGQTMAEAVIPMLAESYKNGRQPPLLKAFSGD